MYAIQFTEHGLENVRALPKNTRNSLKRVLLQEFRLAPAAHSTELNKPLQDLRSFHWKQYRIVFKILEDRRLVVIVGVGERSPQSMSNVCKRLERLAVQGRLAKDIIATLRGFSK